MWFLTRVKRQALRADSLLYRYQQSGDYTDCFFIQLNKSVPQPKLIQAFYCTWLFKLERYILALFVKRPSADQDTIEIANATRTTFSAWEVEEQTTEQLLMCDFEGRTRHWLMAESSGNQSTLYFGSAVIKGGPNTSRLARLVFGLLGSFHILYSRLLLAAAARKLAKN